MTLLATESQGLWTVKRDVAHYLAVLHEHGLVPWSSGNISARTGDDLMVIKPSGISYHSGGLVPDNMVVVGFDGLVVGGHLKPSIDTPIHLGIYRQRPDVNAVVHTHSTYATAFATVGQNIPPVTTMAADEFGGEVLCSGILLTEPQDIAAVVASATMNGPAMLLRQHGVFTVGPTIERAVRAAVLVEEVAKVALLAGQLGKPKWLPERTLRKLYAKYHQEYGQ